MLRPISPEISNNRPATSDEFSPAAFGRLAGCIGKTLAFLGGARIESGLTAEQILIFMAIGHLGLVASARTITMRAVSCVEASALLAISRETIRRKSQRLLDLDLLRMTTTGLVVTSADTWLAMAQKMLPPERD